MSKNFYTGNSLVEGANQVAFNLHLADRDTRDHGDNKLIVGKTYFQLIKAAKSLGVSLEDALREYEEDLDKQMFDWYQLKQFYLGSDKAAGQDLQI